MDSRFGETLDRLERMRRVPNGLCEPQASAELACEIESLSLPARRKAAAIELTRAIRRVLDTYKVDIRCGAVRFDGRTQDEIRIGPYTIRLRLKDG